MSDANKAFEQAKKEAHLADSHTYQNNVYEGEAFNRGFIAGSQYERYLAPKAESLPKCSATKAGFWKKYGQASWEAALAWTKSDDGRTAERIFQHGAKWMFEHLDSTKVFQLTAESETSIDWKELANQRSQDLHEKLERIAALEYERDRIQREAIKDCLNMQERLAELEADFEEGCVERDGQRAKIEELETKLQTAVTALETLGEFNRTHGYPMGGEWIALVEKTNAALAKIKETEK